MWQKCAECHLKCCVKQLAMLFTFPDSLFFKYSYIIMNQHYVLYRQYYTVEPDPPLGRPFELGTGISGSCFK